MNVRTKTDSRPDTLETLCLDLARRAKVAAAVLAAARTAEKDAWLLSAADALEKRSEEVLTANAEDVAAALARSSACETRDLARSSALDARYSAWSSTRETRDLARRAPLGAREPACCAALAETRAAASAVALGAVMDSECITDEYGQRVEKRDPYGRVWRYQWNVPGRLVRVRLPEGSDVAFGYDALGRRVWKRHRGQITRFIWDGDVPLHEWAEGEADRGSDSEPITWLFDPDGVRPLAKLAAGTRTAIITDDLGTPTSMLDERGAAVWSAETGIWGELLRVEGLRHACPFRTSPAAASTPRRAAGPPWGAACGPSP